jgi:Porin subfamily
MKMVKSLLLGSAAGLVAVAGAQAADLPVKAKPIQYVKICTLYGVGFYYIPGTDMCIKIGGYVRAEYAYGVNGSSVRVQGADLNNRWTNDLWWRVRGYITADARDQTEYGTVRGYIAVGISTDGMFDPPQTFNANRAFIQWAGFTFGRAQSFFDFFSQAAIGYLGFTPNSDTGDGGWEVFGYTAQLGNGFSATLSAESRRTTQIIGQGINCGGGITNIGTVAAPIFVPCFGGFTGTGFNQAGLSVAPNVGSINGSGVTGAASTAGTGEGYGGWKVPDVVANLRVDQAWGSAAIAGALHEVNAAYFLNNANNTFLPEGSGGPDTKWGWALMGGLRLNTPFIGTGDYLQLQGIYTQGALRYIFQNPNNNNWWLQHGFDTAYGVAADGVYGGTNFNAQTGNPSVFNNTATGINLTTAWGINAGYEHFWTPRWRTSLYGGYTSVSYNNQANNILCTLQGSGINVSGGLAAGVGVFAQAGPGCDNNWTSWWVGSRTQWNVTKDFYMGLDVAYLKTNGMSTTTGTVIGNAVVPQAFTATGAAGANNATVGFKSLGDEGIWMARFRVHRDFYP